MEASLTLAGGRPTVYLNWPTYPFTSFPVRMICGLSSKVLLMSATLNWPMAVPGRLSLKNETPVAPRVTADYGKNGKMCTALHRRRLTLELGTIFRYVKTQIERRSRYISPFVQTSYLFRIS